MKIIAVFCFVMLCPVLSVMAAMKNDTMKAYERACEEGNLETLWPLEDALLIDQLLAFSCQYAPLESIQFLVRQKKANVNSKRAWDGSPLLQACMRGDDEIVIFLKKQHAAFDQSTQEENLFHQVCMRKSNPLSSDQNNNDIEPNLLCYMRCYAACGLSYSAKCYDSKGLLMEQTVLHNIVRHLDADLVEQILKGVGDINVQVLDGKTALHYFFIHMQHYLRLDNVMGIVEKEELHIFDLLLNAGADMYYLDKDNKCPLDYLVDYQARKIYEAHANWKRRKHFMMFLYEYGLWSDDSYAKNPSNTRYTLSTIKVFENKDLNRFIINFL